MLGPAALSCNLSSTVGVWVGSAGTCASTLSRQYFDCPFADERPALIGPDGMRARFPHHRYRVTDAVRWMRKHDLRRVRAHRGALLTLPKLGAEIWVCIHPRLFDGVCVIAFLNSSQCHFDSLSSL
jgi:hypothetical protein